MAMRDYDELENVKIPAEQERIMDIICDAWEECRESDCPCDHGLQTNHSIFACTASNTAGGETMIQNNNRKKAIKSIEKIEDGAD